MQSLLNRSASNTARFQSPQSTRLREFFIRHATTVRAFEDFHESSTVVAAPFVKAKHLLVNVGFQMESARSDIRAVERAFQARPKVFDIVGVNAAFDIAERVVDELVSVVAISLPIRAQGVGIQHRSWQHVRVNARDERRGFVIRRDHRANAAPGADLAHAALDHAKDRDLARRGSVGELPHSEDVNFGGARLSADERLVHFDLAREGRGARLFHRKADTVEHEPRRLLRDPNRAPKFVRGSAVLGVRQDPDRGANW